jgi:hypothetical protein
VNVKAWAIVVVAIMAAAAAVNNVDVALSQRSNKGLVKVSMPVDVSLLPIVLPPLAKLMVPSLLCMI